MRDYYSNVHTLWIVAVLKIFLFLLSLVLCSRKFGYNIFAKREKYKMEPGTEKLTKYFCETPTVKKAAGNLTAGLHKCEDNKRRQ